MDPVQLMSHCADAGKTGCLTLSHSGVTWKLLFEQGGLSYASNSCQQAQYLKSHLQYLGASGVPAIQALGSISEIPQTLEHLVSDLYIRGYLNSADIKKVMASITKQALEPLLWLSALPAKWVEGETMQSLGLPVGVEIPVFNVSTIIQYFQDRQKLWQKMSPSIRSPYQRLYLFDHNDVLKGAIARGELSEKMYDTLTKLLKGFSFNALSPLLGQTDLKIAQFLFPYIQQGAIVVREPDAPFNQLPLIPYFPNQVDVHSDFFKPTKESKKTKLYKIVCVDDSPTILDQIQRLLDPKVFEVTKIDDPVKASPLLFRIKPDLILMDINMPQINGYKLCNLLRGSDLFKETPIVMVTGNNGFIDRAKAKFSGATDYLTKPFSRDSLTGVITKYLGSP
jgi:twitching motility two-component system response regulator PilG